MKRILILQNKILHYRKSFFNELSKNYDVTVIHSGSKSVNTNDIYKEIIVDVNSFGPFFIQKGILREIRKDKYDVIISMFDLRWINNILSLYLRPKKTKFIWWGAWLTNSKIANFFRVKLSKLKNVNSIFYTKESMNDFISLGVSPNNSFLANNTFDVGDRIKSYENNIKNKVLFVGSLDKRKQNDILIRAFHRINKENKIILCIIGDGAELSYLKSLVKELKIEKNVTFEGKITDVNTLKNYYRESIVSVSFGQAGLSVLQSLGYGVPFITKINAISGGEKTNIIDGYNGFFCEDSLESLEKKIKLICSAEEKYRDMGKNAFNYYSEYCTIENMVQGFIDAIENTRLAK